MKALYNNPIIIKKHWYGNEKKDNFIEVELISRGNILDDGTDEFKKCIVELPTGERKLVYATEIYEM